MLGIGLTMMTTHGRFDIFTSVDYSYIALHIESLEWMKITETQIALQFRT